MSLAPIRTVQHEVNHTLGSEVCSWEIYIDNLERDDGSSTYETRTLINLDGTSKRPIFLIVGESQGNTLRLYVAESGRQFFQLNHGDRTGVFRGRIVGQPDLGGIDRVFINGPFRCSTLDLEGFSDLLEVDLGNGASQDQLTSSAIPQGVEIVALNGGGISFSGSILPESVNDLDMKSSTTYGPLEDFPSIREMKFKNHPSDTPLGSGTAEWWSDNPEVIDITRSSVQIDLDVITAATDPPLRKIITFAQGASIGSPGPFFETLYNNLERVGSIGVRAGDDLTGSRSDGLPPTGPNVSYIELLGQDTQLDNAVFTDFRNLAQQNSDASNLLLKFNDSWKPWGNSGLKMMVGGKSASDGLNENLSASDGLLGAVQNGYDFPNLTIYMDPGAIVPANLWGKLFSYDSDGDSTTGILPSFNLNTTTQPYTVNSIDTLTDSDSLSAMVTVDDPNGDFLSAYNNNGGSRAAFYLCGITVLREVQKKNQNISSVYDGGNGTTIVVIGRSGGANRDTIENATVTSESTIWLY